MRIAVVQTYPIYHDLITTDQWIEKDTRDLLIPSLLSDMGYEVELWAVGKETRSIPMKGYTLQVFKPDRDHKKTKFHRSSDLIAHAGKYLPEACLLKGVDGGIGTHLIQRYLLPNKVSFSFVVGGEYYSRFVRNASCMLIESEKQRSLLTSPAHSMFWRKKYPYDRIIRLPKTVDLDHFSPSADGDKTWDVITSGRLISNYKSYTALDVLPASIRIAVLGGGPKLAELKATFPDVEWLGHVPHSEVANYLRKSNLFIYTSMNDFFPRSIAEAIACGLPTIAVKGNLSEDVVSRDRGIICAVADLKQQILSLLADPHRLQSMSEQCRSFALQEFGPGNLMDPLEKAISLMQGDLASRS